MSTLATRIGREAGRPYMPIEIFNISASRENALAFGAYQEFVRSAWSWLPGSAVTETTPSLFLPST